MMNLSSDQVMVLCIDGSLMRSMSLVAFDKVLTNVLVLTSKKIRDFAMCCDV